jgi:hypothetical protein
MPDNRGFNFDPRNYKEDQVDRIAVVEMDFGFVAVIPGYHAGDGEYNDDPNHATILCLKQQFIMEVDERAYTYEDVVVIIRAHREVSGVEG